MMISTPNRIGRATSMAAGGEQRQPAGRAVGPVRRLDRARPRARRRTKFSIITTRAVDDQAEVDGAERHQVGRHAEQPHADEPGTASTAGSPPRRSATPGRRAGRRTARPRRAGEPSSRLRRTVRGGAVDDLGLVVEGHDRARRPAASLRSRRCAAFTRAPTSRPFSPFSMMTMPATVSPRPSRVTAPWRGIGAGAHVGDVARRAPARRRPP